MFTLLLLLASTVAQAGDTFPIQFALRDKANPRTVVFQGVSTHEIKSLCGPSGEACSCVFYSRNPNRKPVRTAQVDLNLTHNSASCRVPSPVNPELLSQGQLMNTFTRVASEKLNLRRELSLQDLLGPEAASKVNAVYNYECQKTFLEGEGVSPTEVSCPPSQRFGLIHTTYQFSLFNSISGGNLGRKQANTAYDDSICERQIQKYTCDGAPAISYGTVKNQEGIFQVGLTLTPNTIDLSEHYGFAAMADAAGQCPVGLEKVQIWEAHPESITAGSIDGQNPPSSFINENGNLRSAVLQAAQPAPMKVMRQANNMPCAPATSVFPVPGSCQIATFLEPTVVQSAAFQPRPGQVACAIPANLLKGLF